MDIYENLELGESDIQQFSDDAQDWLYTHGVVMRNEKHKHLINFAPFMLFPTPFPKYLYDEAMLLQKDFQTMVHLASLDHEFIKEALKSVVIHDQFTKRQYEIYDQVRKERCKPKLYFNITRSDYMIDQALTDIHMNENTLKEIRPYEIKQVEINMIAASFGGLDTNIAKLHRFMVDVMGNKAPYKRDNLPQNTTLEKLGAGLAKIWQLYDVESAVIVFVIQDGERNRFDQRLLEYSFYENINKLRQKIHVPILYRSFQQIHKNGILSSDGRFILEENEVALFYFRTGYSPDVYTEDAWNVRLLMERSIAAKCPTMAEQLVGTKKVQQIFAAPGMVEKFIKDPEVVKRIRRTFAGLYTLDEGPEGDFAAELALKNPSKYVLKPQREGGGNNMFDDELVAELKRVTDPVERSQYILMERIIPPVVKNYMVHIDFKKPMIADTVTELGIFGVFISNGEQEIFNDASGHLLRTKSIEHKDGGVAAGRALLDTPYMII